VEVEETLLPGVGIRYEMQTRSGRTIGIVIRREGGTEVSVYDVADRDRAVDVIRLEPEEADTVADILGAPRITQRFADLSREVPGLRSARLVVEPGSAFDGSTLGETRARTLTGCSVVAVVRGAHVVTAPGPAQPLQGGDVLVVIGAHEGLDRLATLLGGAGGW
jgi:TrkA domain protein